MLSDKIFIITFVISAVLHGIILMQPSNFRLFPFQKKARELKEIEVSYLKIPQEIKEPQETRSDKNQPLPKPAPKVLAHKPPPPFVDKESIFKRSKEALARKAPFTKPTFIKPDVISIKKKITLPPVDIDKINNPVYISYYQIIREKIKRAAYYNYSRSETGEVYLSFVVSSDGTLKEVRLVEEKSSTAPYLRDCALKSIKDASPFPVFPKELQYQQLSFNVIISFEIE